MHSFQVFSVVVYGGAQLTTVMEEKVAEFNNNAERVVRTVFRVAQLC